MRTSLLAQPGIDDGLSACRRAAVEHVPDGLLVEPDQCEHYLVVGGEPADDPDGNVGVVGVGDPPQLMAAGRPDSLKGGGFFIRLGREVVERLQERDCDFQELAALLFGAGESAVELVCPVDDHAPSMSSS
jgi:hypothetical protein